MAGRRCSCKKVSVMRRRRNSSSEYSLFLGNSIKEAPVLGDVGEMRRLDIFFHPAFRILLISFLSLRANVSVELGNQGK
jgi:hypothetical protein